LTKDETLTSRLIDRYRWEVGTQDSMFHGKLIKLLLTSAASHVVVGGEKLGAVRTLDGLAENLSVAVGKQGQEGRLRARRDAVVLVHDLDAHGDPLAPGDLDAFHVLGGQQRLGEGIAEQVGNGHLRLAVLDGSAQVAEVIARKDAHENGAGRLAPARPA